MSAQIDEAIESFSRPLPVSTESTKLTIPVPGARIAGRSRRAPGLADLRRDPMTAEWSAHDLTLDPLPAPVHVGPHSARLAVERDGGVHLAYGRLLEPLGYAHRRFCP